MVKCANGRALLAYNYCIMYKEETSTISLSSCIYFEFSGRIISEPGFVDLWTNE